MQLNGRDSSTVSKSIDSCHSKEYTENISLTSLTLSTLGASHTAQEKTRVLWCACAEVVNLWMWLSFRFVSRFVLFLNLYAEYWLHIKTERKLTPTQSRNREFTLCVLLVPRPRPAFQLFSFYTQVSVFCRLVYTWDAFYFGFHKQTNKQKAMTRNRKKKPCMA